MRKILFIIFSLAILLNLQTVLRAEDLPIMLSLDTDLVEVGDAVQLSLAFDNEQEIAAPELPEIDGFKGQYLGPSTMMSIINGKASSSITHRYILIALKPGKFKIGPFSFTYNGNVYKSQAREVEIVSRGKLYGQKQQSSRNPVPAEAETKQALEDRIFLTLAVEKINAYLNERIPVTIKLYVDQLMVRDIQYPVLEGQGYVKDAFSRPRQYKEQLSNIVYDVIEFNTYMYATREGKLNLGEAALQCNLVIKDRSRRRGLDGFFDNDFFDDSFFGDVFGRSRIYPLDLKSARLTMDISALPEQNKPPEFNGAVGDFRVQVDAEPKQLKAGDPITLSSKITGDGNFDSVSNPALVSTDDFKIYNPEVKTDKEVKLFEQVIIPQSDKIKEIPVIKFAYFNPNIEDYVVIEKGPIPISVSPSDETQVKMIDASISKDIKAQATTQVLGRDIIYIKEEPGKWKEKGQFLYKNRTFVGLQFLPLILLILTFIVQRRKERLDTDLRYARKLRAPRVARMGLKKAKQYLNSNKTKEFYDIIFKTLKEYLGHRFARPSAGMTSEVVEDLIKSEGLGQDIAAKLKTCFSECDIARYAASSLKKDSMQNSLESLQEIIDYLERKKR